MAALHWYNTEGPSMASPQPSCSSVHKSTRKTKTTAKTQITHADIATRVDICITKERAISQCLSVDIYDIQQHQTVSPKWRFCVQTVGSRVHKMLSTVNQLVLEPTVYRPGLSDTAAAGNLLSALHPVFPRIQSCPSLVLFVFSEVISEDIQRLSRLSRRRGHSSPHNSIHYVAETKHKQTSVHQFAPPIARCGQSHSISTISYLVKDRQQQARIAFCFHHKPHVGSELVKREFI
ncbi:hypothetical protein ABVT39_014053 [Epinephelus coioides]